MAPKRPINQRCAKHNPKYRPCVVHIIRSNRQVRREGQPNNDEKEEADSEDVDGVSPSTEGERSPDWDFSADLCDEEGRDDLEVRHVEGEIVEREDGVDGGC